MLTISLLTLALLAPHAYAVAAPYAYANAISISPGTGTVAPLPSTALSTGISPAGTASPASPFIANGTSTLNIQLFTDTECKTPLANIQPLTYNKNEPLDGKEVSSFILGRGLDDLEQLDFSRAKGGDNVASTSGLRLGIMTRIRMGFVRRQLWLRRLVCA